MDPPTAATEDMPHRLTKRHLVPRRSFRRARSQQNKIRNQEKDAQPEKMTRKIVFSDLRNPLKNFTPLFGEVVKIRTLTKKDEQ